MYICKNSNDSRHHAVRLVEKMNKGNVYCRGNDGYSSRHRRTMIMFRF